MMILLLAEAAKDQNLFQWFLPLFLGGVGGSVITHVLTSSREAKAKTKALRMELYVETLDLLVEYDTFHASLTSTNVIPPVPIQEKRSRLKSKMKLLGSSGTVNAFNAAFENVDRIIEQGHLKPHVPLKNDLISRMRDDLEIDQTFAHRIQTFAHRIQTFAHRICPRLKRDGSKP